jgi:hypothetical protein
MVCRNTSRLKIGRSARPAGLGQLPSGILIGRFSGPRESVACAGRQSLGQRGKDISACGEKSSPSPWSSPRGEEILHSLCVDIVALRRRDIEVERTKLNLERWEFDREQILRKMALLERKRAEANGESKLVQAKLFSGALGSAVRTAAEAGAHLRSGGLLANICMFAKVGVSFSVSPGLGWSVGTMERTTVEGVVGRSDERDFDMAPRRECGEVSGDGGRSGSNLRGFAFLRDKSEIFGGSRRESNQVQAIAFFFAGAGIRARTSTGTGAHSRSGGLLANIYAGRDAALRGPRRRAQRQATQSPGFPSAPAVDQFRPLNAGGALATRARPGRTRRFKVTKMSRIFPCKYTANA